MLKTKKRIKHCFTLLELIVAMGIFSILMLMLMQFFSGTQKIWTESEKRNTTYADARIAMDLMASMLQSTFYQYNAVPFYIVKGKDKAGNNKQGFDQIYFVAKSPVKLASNANSNLYEVEFSALPIVANKNQLYINYIGDNVITPTVQVPGVPYYNWENSTDYTKLTDLNFATSSEIIPYVTGLEFIPFQKNSASGLVMDTNYSAGATSDFPYAVQIKLTMLDKKSYKLWTEAMGSTGDPNGDSSGSDRETFRKSNERTFTRMVFLGDRK